jgi:hypothetical protein
LLGLHLADLLFTDRRRRDGIKTRRQTARQKEGLQAETNRCVI